MKLITKLFAALLGMTSCTAQNQNVSVIAPNEFKVAFEKDTNGFLLDVRKPEEFADGHVKGAALLNWLDEETFKQEAPKMLDKAKTIYVYCRSGRRSNAAANWLAAQGYKVVDMKGGILAWNEAGLPTTVYDVDSFTTENGSIDVRIRQMQ